METLLYRCRLLDPIEHGLFAFKLLSHKVVRWAVPIAFIPALLGLLILATTHYWARGLVWAILPGAAIAGLGAVWPASRKLPRLLSVLTFAASANIAVVHAFIRVLFGHQDHLWEPTRRAPTASAEAQTA